MVSEGGFRGAGAEMGRQPEVPVPASPPVPDGAAEAGRSPGLPEDRSAPPGALGVGGAPAWSRVPRAGRGRLSRRWVPSSAQHTVYVLHCRIHGLTFSPGIHLT